MPFAVANEISVYYEEAGAGEALLFISGQNTDHSQWDSFGRLFTDSYRVVTYDHRGTGRSDRPTTPYTTRTFAEDAVALLDCLEIERAHVFGASMGGRVAQWLAIAHPDRTGTVTLACTSPGDRHGIKRDSEAAAALTARPTGKPETDPLLPYLVSENWASEHPEYTESVVNRRDDPAERHSRRLHFEASQSHDAWMELESIRVPVLVLHGDNDRLNATGNAALLADRIPGAELALIPGGRHEFFTEFPRQSAEVVRSFIGRHPLTSS